LVVLLLLAGCATTRGRGVDLGYLRGQPVLVVADIEEGADARAILDAQQLEAALVRALAVVPLRLWPGAADAGLRQRLAAAATRLEDAREAAEVRRLPWLLVRSSEGLRIETTRGAKVLWQLSLADRRPLHRAVRGLTRVLSRASAAGDEPQATVVLSTETRLADAFLLAELRLLAVAKRWQEHRRLAAQSVERWPADPAVRVHAILAAAPAAEVLTADLRAAVAMNPDGESELLALALAAEAAGQRGLALLWREQLVKLFPQRIDYRPELADLFVLHDEAEAALRLCRSGLSRVDGEAIQKLPRGTAPHQHSGALPYADLSFATGWYLALAASWELAAHNYLRAEQVYEALGRPRERADALNNAGVAMVQAGRPLAAAGALRTARALRAEQGTPKRTATSSYNLARALADADRPVQSLEAYRQAVLEYRRAGAEQEALETAIERLAVVARTGDAQALERDADAVLGQLAAWGGDAGELRASLLYELGRGRHSLGLPEQALAAYQQALEAWRQLGRRLEVGQLLYSMALPHLALLRFEAAHRDLVSALQIAVDLGDSTSIIAIREQLRQVEELLRARGEQVPSVPEQLRPWLQGEGQPVR